MGDCLAGFAETAARRLEESSVAAQTRVCQGRSHPGASSVV